MPFKIIRIKTKTLWELFFPLDAKNESVIASFKRVVIFFLRKYTYLSKVLNFHLDGNEVLHILF